MENRKGQGRDDGKRAGVLRSAPVSQHPSGGAYCCAVVVMAVLACPVVIAGWALWGFAGLAAVWCAWIVAVALIGWRAGRRPNAPAEARVLPSPECAGSQEDRT
jgi:hypothetical protein